MSLHLVLSFGKHDEAIVKIIKPKRRGRKEYGKEEEEETERRRKKKTSN